MATAVRELMTPTPVTLPSTVVEGGIPVGILAIGDLAVALDEDSALADISASPPNE